MKTKQEIILETIEYYKTNPRAYDSESGFCSYLDADGAMCAVGRCLDPEKVDRKRITGSASDITLFDGTELKRFSLETILLEEYKGHEVLFWSMLQALHDGRANWNKTETGWELSEMGQKQLKKLEKGWEN